MQYLIIKYNIIPNTHKKLHVFQINTFSQNLQLNQLLPTFQKKGRYYIFL